MQCETSNNLSSALECAMEVEQAHAGSRLGFTRLSTQVHAGSHRFFAGEALKRGDGVSVGVENVEEDV